MLEKEVSVMLVDLKRAGFDVVVATASGKPIHAGAQTLSPDCALSAVAIEEYDGVVLPCMLTLWDSVDPLAIELVRKARGMNKPVAGQNTGALIVSRAGALVGRHYGIEAGLDKLVPGGIYEGEGVVVDGDIVTAGLCPNHAQSAGKPDTTRELIEQFVKKVQLRAAESAAESQRL